MKSEVSNKKVIAYIDGFNLHHGLRHSQIEDCRWMDVRKLCKTTLKPGESLVGVKYFTARMKYGSQDSLKQAIYIEALQEYCQVEVIEGFFLKNKSDKGNYFYTEKGSDVNLATELLCDAFDDKFDMAILVSGDGDFFFAIEKVIDRFKKKVLVAFPPARTTRRLQSIKGVLTKRLSNENVKSSLLPSQINLPSGKFLYAPKGWHPAKSPQKTRGEPA